MAYVAVSDLFSIGIGPSSSHTVGPMRAAAAFASSPGVQALLAGGASAQISDARVTDARVWDARVTDAQITCDLYGSLGATGIGHGTPDAVVAGLGGSDPETCDPLEVRGACERAAALGSVSLGAGVLGAVPVRFAGVALAPLTRLPFHPNALRLTLSTPSGVVSETYYSVGGGFVLREGDAPIPAQRTAHPFEFSSADGVLADCVRTGLSIADLARANELAARTPDELDAVLDRIWAAMSACVDAGLAATGTLPGRLNVPRRARALACSIETAGGPPQEMLQAYAIAVNEENAAGSRVVTAPTNGAAGIVPAVGRYIELLAGGPSPELLRTYLLTAGAIGSLVKSNASISGAEAGCQGEVGTACSMAAAGACAAWGGTPAQVENAAEIAMEHHLGLTCDPVAGLVQIPCIERNAIAASTAVTAARLALHGDGAHLVSLDTVIETMRQTGVDMSSKYKETSLGGLAVNVVEC